MSEYTETAPAGQHSAGDNSANSPGQSPQTSVAHLEIQVGSSPATTYSAEQFDATLAEVISTEGYRAQCSQVLKSYNQDAWNFHRSWQVGSEQVFISHLRLGEAMKQRYR